MDLTASKPRVTPLLSNDALHRIERLRINSSRRFTSRTQGEHLAGRGGNSTEFNDYRDYTAGDDLRFVDWNIFSRLHRPYLKLYRMEEEMHVVILLDASSSMLFEDKLARAKQVATALAVMGLHGGERVTLCAANEYGAAPDLLPPRRGRQSMRRAFEFLEKVEGGGDAPVDSAIDGLLKRFTGRGIVVIVSDFLTFGDLRRAFNSLFSSGLETWAVQVLGPSELDPQLTGDSRLVDVETGATLDVSQAGDLLTLYQEYRLGYQQMLEQLCRQRGGRFLSLSSAETVESILFDTMRRGGWVR